MIDAQRDILAKLEAGVSITADDRLGTLVNFRGSATEPVQRWFPYREGYSLGLVEKFLAEFDVKGTVYDPFCGSGTTLLAARRRGLRAVGIDINPLSALVSEVKNSPYDSSAIAELTKIQDAMLAAERPLRTRDCGFALAEKVFNVDILQALLELRDLVRGVRQPQIRKLALTAWLSIVEQVSNVKKEGNGVKYRNRRRTAQGYVEINREEWERANFPSDRFAFVRDLLVEKLRRISCDITDAYGRCDPPPRISCGDCLRPELLPDDALELTFFSPPYCNCFDYFEIHKLELWLGGFVSGASDFRKLKASGFRSNTNALLGKEVDYHNASVEKLVALFDGELWNKRIPDVIKGYFEDMHTLLEMLRERTASGGRIGVVAGNSAYGGVVIPTDLLIADLAREAGLKVEWIRVTRHLTTSPQQIRRLAPLREYLRESIIMLRK